ncbi:nuclear transport factor 2 family protein [Lacihabitans sp. LS3-19]|uniref:nuclear transport factor 2 family protein n=1 Tax=Lacihabitans sp. LS3-19 TaxID=2487335 RepID=UPI0020CEFC1D|nr:nuclear transport factor 2 family protein [Lacihabitans sp. LS3-19]
MNNAELIENFYRAFQSKDYISMQNSYAPDATFSDEVFQNLNGVEAGKMWEMLIKAGKDMELKYQILESKDDTIKARWIAKYTFSKTGRMVINDIKAEFKIKDGKIIRHRDKFDFYKWSRQALGFSGLLLGWTLFLKNKVRATAMSGLKKFIEK